ncbi:hypothetical protein HYS92_02010 [Candidatus Daviesbacteria bacterium]|nr:hypothetical protein [Candidatus Daviesbacteria bacterium]
MRQPDSEPQLNLNRRQFLKGVVPTLIVGQQLLDGVVEDVDKLLIAGARYLEAHNQSALVASNHPLWPVSHTRQWLPLLEHIANKWEIYKYSSTFEPYNIWNIYDELEAREYGPRGHSREFAEYYENYLWAETQKERRNERGEVIEPEGYISRAEESWGFCYEMTKIRVLWQPPALGGREINGLQITERGLFHLIVVAGTHVAMTNVRTDQVGILDRLAQFVDGRDTRTPVVNQPKPGQPGIWYRNIGGVLESLSDIYVDDFNLLPTYLSTDLIQAIFDPYLVQDRNAIPDYLRAEVEASFMKQAPFPINVHLIYRILYGSPVIQLY